MFKDRFWIGIFHHDSSSAEGKYTECIESFASVFGLECALKVREYVIHAIVFASIRQAIACLRIEKRFIN